MTSLTDQPLQVDYAPTTRRRLVTASRVMFILLFLAATGAMWVVLPRVFQRASLLEAQESVLEGRGRPPAGAWVADTTWIASRPGMMMPDAKNDSPELARFTSWAITGAGWPQAAFFGGRDAGSGQRIVIVSGSPAIHGSGRSPEITFTVYVFEPGGWFREPRLVNQTALGPVILPVYGDAGWRLAVFSGQPDPANPARFLIELEAGYDGHAEERRMTVVGHLMPDDSIRFDWPTDSEPANAQNTVPEWLEPSNPAMGGDVE